MFSNPGTCPDDGDMKSIERSRSLKTIANDPSVKIILISLKAGGEGLNLTSCNNVVFLDPWWNPAVEVCNFARYFSYHWH
jgi:SNF2 family DNA or RNA helicase